MADEAVSAEAAPAPEAEEAPTEALDASAEAEAGGKSVPMMLPPLKRRPRPRGEEWLSC